MFIIRCSNCGREQEWKAGTDVGTAAIQFAGNECICDCGHVVSEEDCGLHEGFVEDL